MNRLRTFFRVIGALCMFLLVDTVFAVDIGTRRQLLVDDYVISETKGIKRELGVVTKENDGKPIFDARFYGTVLHDEGRFKMWYRKPGREGYGYAESRDGLTGISHLELPETAPGSERCLL